jgi:catabolite repression HPr-like protein
MIKKSIKISCPRGLEPRPIAELVQVASKYESKIYLETETKRVNAKSIMGMMSLGLIAGEDVTVTADGSDEQDAVSKIEKFLTKVG